MSEVDPTRICLRCGEVSGVTGACRCPAVCEASAAVEIDLVDELRDEADAAVGSIRICVDAIAEIKRLRAEIKRLQEQIRDERLEAIAELEHAAWAAVGY